MHITFVKKLLADGSPCGKCVDVQQRLDAGDWMRYVDHVAVADERDSDSEGMRLAQEFDVKRAPFFIIRRDNGAPEIHTIFLRFVREVLEPLAEGGDAAREVA
ncbi:MAG: hypothetical protein HKO62_09555 [Gammaproteobacteria bacterium]|nr:hypothetical protein [Gammaproteobacteria bacterium]